MRGQSDLTDEPACVTDLQRSVQEVREDWNTDVFTAVHSETHELWKNVEQISQEMHETLKQAKPLGNRWTLGEVMCSSKSPITQQTQQGGKMAFRFGLAQGDLSTTAGRAELFRLVGRHRPRHIWYSPTCGPWSSWSQLNASRSLHHQNSYHEQRRGLLYQIALGIVLYRYQMENKSHFHWEQPQKSLMFLNPNMAEVHEHTKACQFDMCRAGNLVDPENHMPMKKGMTVLTTFEPLFSRFHGMTCDNRHQHQPIEGSCKLENGQRVLRSTYTEVYPRKFARAVAQVLSKGITCLPFNWNSEITSKVDCGQDRGSQVLTVATKFRAKPSFAKSDVVTPVARADPESKRSKLDHKQGDAPTLEMCQQALQMVNEILPRVGRMEVMDHKVMSMLQQVFPDKQVHRVIACRGTERTIEPPHAMHAQEAPYRRMLMMRRDGTVQYEKHWERWTELSKRQLKRPSHACRINITVFASDLSKNSPPSVSAPLGKNNKINIDDTEASSSPPRESASGSDATVPSRPSDEQFEMPMHESPTVPTAVRPEKVDAEPGSGTSKPAFERLDGEAAGGNSNTAQPASQQTTLDPLLGQQSARFRSLPKWEQHMIVKLHKNLGHPSNDRLVRALQVNGSRPAIIQAAAEIRCPACAAHVPPKHARPASLKPLLDFNSKVYLDGVNWTSNQGKTYHFFHVLDAGSNYHVAMASPSKTTENLIHTLNQHWISWAGPPSELVVDSGTEMNSKEFTMFTQRFNIRSTTTSPEAHWQSGKIEGHGAFLQTMLSKIDMEIPINSYQDLQIALNQSVHAKNSLSIRHGYAPEIIVFGKHTRLPGSVLSDESLPSHEQAIREESELCDSEFRQLLSVREAARRAYHEADNNDVLRRALLRRSCPSRGIFQRGQWVMIWRSGNSNQPKWYGPHRVITQDEHHTVWCTSSGKLFRSAPENTRLACPEEGSPEGPDLPEDMTPMMQQIHRMTDNSNPNDNSQNTNLDIPNEIIPNHNNHNQSHNPLSFDQENSDSQDESIPQPDTEPENTNSEDQIHEPPESQNDMPASADQSEGQDITMLTCHEPENAFTCEDAGTLTWSCEFDVPLNAPLSSCVPTVEESWVMLATATKKQRTEVKLSSLSASELAEFQKAKQAEVDNWIKTGTISAILRNQIPEEQILRCRWILTWKPLDNVGDNDHTNSKREKTGTPSRTHKAKARLVVLGYLDPEIENIPRDSPTLNKTSRMVALQVIASHSWKIRSFDIKAAFLQGRPQADRVIAVDPVPELRQAMSLKPQQICKLNKSAYGL